MVSFFQKSRRVPDCGPTPEPENHGSHRLNRPEARAQKFKSPRPFLLCGGGARVKQMRVQDIETLGTQVFHRVSALHPAGVVGAIARVLGRVVRFVTVTHGG